MFCFTILSVAALALTTLAETSVLAPTPLPTHTWAQETTIPFIHVTSGFNLPWNTTRPAVYMPTEQQGDISSATHSPNPLPADNTTQSSNRTLLPSEARLTVTVGEGGNLTFAPSSLNVSIGSTIAFNFLGLNHTLTESSLRNPCERSGGFDTGFSQFNPTNASGKFVVEYKVLDRSPRWFFCAQTRQRPHCQAGMVFSLNPQGAHAMFLSNALTAIPLPEPATSEGACHQKPNSDIPPLRTASSSSTVSSISTTTVLPIIMNSAGLHSYRQSILALITVFLL